MVESSRTIMPTPNQLPTMGKGKHENAWKQTMAGKTAVNLPAGNSSQPSYWFWPRSWEARVENRKEDGILGPTGFDLKIKIMQACRELTWTTVINPCHQTNAKTDSSRNFQLAAWKTVCREADSLDCCNAIPEKDSKKLDERQLFTVSELVAELFQRALSTGTFTWK